MANTCLKVSVVKSDVLKTSILQIKKIRLQNSFLGGPTHAKIIEIPNFVLQLKNRRIADKPVCGFSIIFFFLKNLVMF